MSAPAAIVGLGLADALGLKGSRGLDTTWAELGVEPGGTPAVYRYLFDEGPGNFRRFDRAARLLNMACEAADLSRLIPPSAREDTALILETELGCLQTDRHFARSLGTDLVDSNTFPYTLANTCLGELAIRYGLRGPTLCLSLAPGQDGPAFHEAARLLEDGEAHHAVVARLECLDEPIADWKASALACVAVLKGCASGMAESDSVRPVAAWPEGGQAIFAGLLEALAISRWEIP